jgi:hypothetical protein
MYWGQVLSERRSDALGDIVRKKYRQLDRGSQLLIFTLPTAAQLSLSDENEVISQIKSKESAVTRNEFYETEFLPIVDKMIKLLSKDQCKGFLSEYLKALAFKTASVDETLTDQLGKIIHGHVKELNMSCAYLSKNNLIKLSGKFKWTIKTAYFNKTSETELASRIPKCYE